MTNQLSQNTTHLTVFRVLLTALHLDGFLVPRSDAYQNESVSLRDQRLKWLTGYTGSAGMAVVLSTRAALFVDGRYTVQAHQEVDTTLYDIQHLFDNTPPASWIRRMMHTGGRIGYDPWLHTAKEIEQLNHQLEGSDILLVAYSDNPIDRVWTDQPPPPITSTRPHPIPIAGRTSEAKRLPLSQELQNKSVDAVVITMPDTIAWLLNIRGNDIDQTPVSLSFAILYATGHVAWFIDMRKVSPETQQHLDADVTLYPIEKFAQHLDHLGQEKKRVLVDPSVTPMWIVDRLQTARARIHQGSDPCALAKTIKNPTELDGIRAAHQRDGVAVVRFLHWLETQADPKIITEISAAQYLFELRQQNDSFRGNSFETISAAGDHGALVHYRVSQHSNRPLAGHFLYLCDSGAQYLDGTTDITRTVAILDSQEEYSLPHPLREHFTRVLKGHIALASLCFPSGVTGAQLDGFTRRPLWEIGLDYDHGTGHGVGCYLNVHEPPVRIAKYATIGLREGMVVSNEPGYYKAGHYGIRIENVMAIQPYKHSQEAEQTMVQFETLTLAPMDRRLILADRLSDAERSWLNAYHRRVCDTLTPHLEASVAAWLNQVTAPL